MKNVFYDPEIVKFSACGGLEGVAVATLESAPTLLHEHLKNVLFLMMDFRVFLCVILC